jgi:hypothetical protein
VTCCELERGVSLTKIILEDMIFYGALVYTAFSVVDMEVKRNP